MTLLKVVLFHFAILILPAITTIPDNSAADRQKPPWSKRLYEALEARDDMIKKVDAVRDGITVKKVRDLLEVLSSIPSKITGLDDLDESFIESDLKIMSSLIHHSTKAIGNQIFRSKSLVENYDKEMGKILRDFQGYHNFRCIQALYSSPESLLGFSYPIKEMCFHVKGKLKQSIDFIFSTDTICTTVKDCTGTDNQKRYPYDTTSGSSEYSNVAEACVGQQNHCDVAKAVPMMAGLLWYKVSNYMARRICRKEINFPSTLTLDEEHKDIENMVKNLMAFTSTLNWKLFFDEAMARRAFSSLDVALGIIVEYEKSFSSAPTACYVLKSDQSCIYSFMNVEYQSIRKLQQLRVTPEKTRNLRLFERVNHGRMVELQRDALDHIEILGNVRSVDDNLSEGATKIKTYLAKLAEYDYEIANQDVIFISGKLEEFANKTKTVGEKLKEDMRAVLIAATKIASLQLADEINTLVHKIGEYANFLKAIFGGVDLGEILEQTGEIAEQASNVARVAAIFENLISTFTNSDELYKKLANNSRQIKGLDELINATFTDTLDEIGDAGELFVAQYGSYTPQVDRSDLDKDDALWGTFTATVCDVLYGAEGALAGAAQIPISGMLMCEKLEGTIAEFTTLREDIFDFQFELVDAMARVVRGLIAKKLASSMKEPNPGITAADLMLGYFKIHNRLQSSASLYCNKLEYLNQGRKIPVCNPKGGLFSRKSLDDLIAYNPDKTYHVDERFVYIPTRPQFPGDKGFISLTTLREGKSVTFRLPNNGTWLRMHNWADRTEKISVPFLESFKLYLPRKNYLKGYDKIIKTRVRLTSTGSSAVGKGNIVYNLPAEHSQYLTAYTEGFNPSRCPSGKEITNPYSLCGNLPNICDTLSRVAGSSLLPTILSNWKLSYVMETSSENLEWDAPDPATNLLLIAKVKLRLRSLQSSKRNQIPYKDRLPKRGCCAERMYRPKWNDKTCIDCPKKPVVGVDSTSNLGGYYCEKGIVKGKTPGQ